MENALELYSIQYNGNAFRILAGILCGNEMYTWWGVENFIR